MTREEEWEGRILQLLAALPLSEEDGRKRVPVVVLLKAVDAMPIRANHRAIAQILKAQHYTRTSFRTSIGVIAGYISPPVASLPRGKRKPRPRKHKTSPL